MLFGHRVWLLLLFPLFMNAAHATSVREHVLTEGSLACGSAPRPGVAERQPDGQIIGLAVDVCRAVAVGLMGAQSHIAFRLYESEQAFDAARQGRDNLMFVTQDDISEASLEDAAHLGPPIFVDQVSLMVVETSPIRQPIDIADRTVCLMIGSPAQMALESFATAQDLHFARLAFQEDVEMLDAYNVQRCEVAVGETTYLATMRASPGIKRLTSRLLPTPLAQKPIRAATGTQDAAWSALVFRVVAAWLSGVDDTNPDLRPGWLTDVHTSVGDYRESVQRHLVQGLGLAP